MPCTVRCNGGVLHVPCRSAAAATDDSQWYWFDDTPVEFAQLHRSCQSDAVAALQERNADGSDGQWYCFDDNTVEPWDLGEMERDCFGGKYVPAATFPGLKQQVRSFAVL